MRLIFIASILFFLSGCAELTYYGHAVAGQLEVMGSGEPIKDVIANPATDDKIRRQLELIQRARRFAVEKLKLPDSDSFREYSDLKRPWVLWNVFATPELSLAPKQWCYPFLGCHGYRVYFDEADAKRLASDLEKEGLDVYIAHSPAYSTQGWFADPVYNPMLRYDDLTLVGILFHELAHERIYITDDSELNESFATTVQDEGVRRWLEDKNRVSDFSDYQREQEKDDDFIRMMIEHRNALQQLYATDLIETEKRSGKKKVFSDLKKKFNKLKRAWGGYSGYDHWFDKPLNNARLAPIGTYHNAVPGFKKLLDKNNYDLDAFYREVEIIAAMHVSARRELVSKLTRQ